MKCNVTAKREVAQHIVVELRCGLDRHSKAEPHYDITFNQEFRESEADDAKTSDKRCNPTMPMFGGANWSVL